MKVPSSKKFLGLVCLIIAIAVSGYVHYRSDVLGTISKQMVTPAVIIGAIPFVIIGIILAPKADHPRVGYVLIAIGAMVAWCPMGSPFNDWLTSLIGTIVCIMGALLI